VLALQRVAGNRAVRRVIQRDVHVPADVSREMIGRQFRLTKAFTAGGVAVKAGDSVEVRSWDNDSETVTVTALPAAAGASTFDVPKKLLVPDQVAVAGVAAYDVGIDQVVKQFEAGEQRLADERARKDKRADEITRLEGLQKNRTRLLNERLIQQTMFNRFDADIKRWTDHYNVKFGFTGAKTADPDMVKSMIFEESQMGTAGPHLDDPPTHPVRTRFNIGQMIDTSSPVILELMREDDPTLISRFHLEHIEPDLIHDQSELERLKKKGKPSDADKKRIKDLEALAAQDWETWMWRYTAPGQKDGFFAAASEYLTAGTAPRNLDYAFWIKASIRELFMKRKGVSSWAEAARAYNGAGPAAAAYRNRVTTRMNKAKAAAKAGKPFVVNNI
jgi:hypothetical protein